jgi:hypothetical protein
MSLHSKSVSKKNTNANCKACSRGADGEACMVFEITCLGTDRGSAVNYFPVSDNFDEFIENLNLDENDCKEEAIKGIKAKLRTHFVDEFSKYIYKKPYVKLKVGDKFKICSLVALTITIHKDCCEQEPPNVEADFSNTTVSKEAKGTSSTGCGLGTN